MTRLTRVHTDTNSLSGVTHAFGEFLTLRSEALHPAPYRLSARLFGASTFTPAPWLRSHQTNMDESVTVALS